MNKCVVFPISKEEAKKECEELAEFMKDDPNKEEWEKFLSKHRYRNEQLFNQLSDIEKKRRLSLLNETLRHE